MSIRFRRMVYVGLACLAVSPAVAQNVSPTIAELATYAGADRTERLIAGAKKEGVVSVYSSVTVDDQKALVNAFEKKYGVKLQFWRASSESILQRAMVEYRGGRYEVDAIESRSIARSSWSR
jgi:iron(III) transport system substrate-binding protein